jgi:hypothetical protein
MTSAASGTELSLRLTSIGRFTFVPYTTSCGLRPVEVWGKVFRDNST